MGITGRFTYNCIDTHQNWRNLQFSTSSLQCHELGPTWHSPKTLAINKHFQSRSMRRIMIFLLVLLEAAANFTIVDTISTQTRTRTGYIQTANAGGFVCWLVSIELQLVHNSSHSVLVGFLDYHGKQSNYVWWRLRIRKRLEERTSVAVHGTTQSEVSSQHAIGMQKNEDYTTVEYSSTLVQWGIEDMSSVSTKYFTWWDEKHKRIRIFNPTGFWI